MMKTLSFLFTFYFMLFAIYCSGQARQATIELAFSETDSSSIITATVSEKSDSGKFAVPDVEVHFYMQRLFGLLPVKSSFGNYADEKGMTSVEIFKKDSFGGDAEGNVTVIAKIEDDDNYGTVETKTSVKIGKPIPANMENFPRELWAPSAPFALIASFGGLVGLVWITYIYVLFLTAKIRRAGNVTAKKNDEK